MSTLVKHLFILLLIFPACVFAKPLTNQPLVNERPENMTSMQAFYKGKFLRSQFKEKEALSYLKYSADTGNREAAYLYAMSILTYHPTTRTELIARDYLLKASKFGHKGATIALIENIQLLKSDQRFALEASYEKALKKLEKSNPADASIELYRLYTTMGKQQLADKYLKNAAELNQPRALYLQAQQLLTKDGYEITRKYDFDKIKNLLTKSAQLGYIPAYRQLIKDYEDLHDFNAAFQWRQKLLEKGDLLTLASMGMILLGYSHDGYSGFKDKLLGVRYLSLYLKYSGKDRMAALYNKVYAVYQSEWSRLNENERGEYETLVLPYNFNNVNFSNFDLYQYYSTRLK